MGAIRRLPSLQSENTAAGAIRALSDEINRCCDYSTERSGTPNKLFKPLE
jgi:hypothetical protein